jgi:hypothetical protein
MLMCEALPCPACAEQKQEDLARCSATMLWTCSKSSKNKEHILKANAVPLLAKLLEWESVDVLVPVVGVLEECASTAVYRWVRCALCAVHRRPCRGPFQMMVVVVWLQ